MTAMHNHHDTTRAITLVVCVFFLWGLSYGLLDVLNKHFQDALHVSKAGSSLLQVAYFLAYFVIAIPAALFNQRFGYRYGLIAGLFLFAVGALLFIPSLAMGSFHSFIGSLFLLACGAGFLETTANPYILQLGESDTAEKRLNLAQALCGLGAVVGPLIGGAFIFSRPAMTTDIPDRDPVVQIYAWIAVFVVLLAVVIAKASAMPGVAQDGKEVRDYRALLAHKRYLFGVLVQFLYVAAQVGVGAFFINYATETSTDISSQYAAGLLSAAMFLFMIGRFVGIYVLGFIGPSRLLAVCGLLNIILCMMVVSQSGYLAVAALCLMFFFMSIMYPTIFSSALRDLGNKKKIGSSLLTMAVCGGAVYPLAMGYIADHFGTATSYLLPMISFIAILIYANVLMREKTIDRNILAVD